MEFSVHSYFSGVTTLLDILYSSIAALILYVVFLAAYNVFFHPLRGYPGPRLFAAYRLPYVIAGNLGYLPILVHKWHDKYGTVIRIAPDELAFETENAWKDILGVHQGRPALEKDPYFLTPPYPGMMPSIGNSDNAQHARYRRLLSHAFSNQALQAQEPLLTEYIDLLIRRLIEASQASDEPQDLQTWFMWATFDIVGDLAFGESFHCLERRSWHPWTETVLAGFEAGLMISAIRRYVPMSLALKLVPTRMMKSREVSFEFAKSKVAARMERGPGGRPDFLSYIMRHNDDEDDTKGLAVTPAQVQPNAVVIVLAGGHTTSTLLCGALYYLLNRPESLQRVVAEVRTCFKSDREITFTAVNKSLPYLLAVLQEALRIYPPVAAGLPRLTPRGGLAIDGRFVPGNVSVSVFHYAAARSRRNFSEADKFLPERWLEQDHSQQFNGDVKGASKPFSYGPRDCMGKHVAYMEMRLILAKVIWHFDLRLSPLSKDWDKKKIHISWERKPLWIHLKRAIHT